MGKIERGVKCSVVDCADPAVKSVSGEKVEAAGLKVEGKKAYLCEAHYREYKKKSKAARQVERWRWTA